MEDITTRHAGVFQGMGRASTEPIHIQIDVDAIPVAQGRRPMPHQLREAVADKLQYMLDNDLIEGQLPPVSAQGGSTI